MKLNRKWLLVIALVVSMATAISGTLAYLTDKDTKTNVFTLGEVNIEVEETFTDGAQINPGAATTKEAKITNKGEKDAWVWMTVSVPKELKDYVTLNWGESYKDNVSGPELAGNATDGYTAVWTVLVNNKLEASESTGNILESVTLSPLVDYQDGKYVVVKNGVVTELEGLTTENKLEVTVTGYAVQADALDSVGAAYEAYNNQWSADSAAKPTASVIELSNNVTLTDDANNTILGVNRAISAKKQSFGTWEGSTELAVAYQFEPTETEDVANAGDYALWHADFVVSADKDVPENGIVLAGYYNWFCQNGNWVMLSQNSQITAGDEIRLVSPMLDGKSINYSELCKSMSDGTGFLCGAVKGKTLGLTDEDVTGTKLTVELRLYELKSYTGSTNSVENETGKYITIGTYTYTF